MQIKLFTIPVGDNGTIEGEMNRFLRHQKVLEIESHFFSNANGASWCFCIRYLEKNSIKRRGREKVDYKEVLDDASFQKFSKLREIRKKLSTEEGIPAFAIFIDEELAALAKLDEITEKTMLSVAGINEKKVARYAKHFITNKEKDETGRLPG